MREPEVKALMTPAEFVTFQQWIEGQTMGIYADGTANIYDWDVERFLHLLRHGIPTIWD
mgnify:CR=1 FL=1